MCIKEEFERIKKENESLLKENQLLFKDLIEEHETNNKVVISFSIMWFGIGFLVGSVINYFILR